MNQVLRDWLLDWADRHWDLAEPLQFGWMHVAPESVPYRWWLPLSSKRGAEPALSIWLARQTAKGA